jgi:GAF domain-containing protein
VGGAARLALMSLSIFSPPPLPANERDRQRAVEASGMLRAPHDPALHQIVVMAARLLDAPMAALSIIDRDRMWFAARIGIDPPETSRAVSFCAHAILRPYQPMVIRDATKDERFAGNPFVQDEPHVRFYVGVPVRGIHGLPIGALCVLDVHPRDDLQALDQIVWLARRAEQAIEAAASAVS